MLSAGKGGLEKAALDYAQALILEGHQVTTLLHPCSAMQGTARKNEIPFRELSNFGEWDLWARLKLKSLLKTLQPDCIIAHGRRAALLLKNLHPYVFPVTHSGYQAYLLDFPGLITMTNYLRQAFIDQGYPPSQIYHVPNMIHGDKAPIFRSYHTPIHLGAMGRMEEKKGFSILLQAAKILKEGGLYFCLTLAGEGECKSALQHLATALGLDEVVDFPGWVQSPQDFFETIDIFCLPSLREPFGIVLLEAFLYGTPTVTSDAEGPLEIADHLQDAFIVSKNDPYALAQGIKEIIDNPSLGRELAEKAFEKVQNVYTIKTVSQRLTQVLKCLLKERTGHDSH